MDSIYDTSIIFESIKFCLRLTEVLWVWNDMMSKWWQHFHFWVNYPFNTNGNSEKNYGYYGRLFCKSHN